MDLSHPVVTMGVFCAYIKIDKSFNGKYGGAVLKKLRIYDNMIITYI